MHVPDFKTGPLPGQTARSQGTQPTFMGNLGKGVGLIHKLRQLTGPEKFFNCRGNRFWVDQVVGHKGFHFLQRHALTDSSFHADQSDTVLVFNQFTNGPYPPVTEMVNVINLALLIFQADQIADRLDDVFLGQGFDRNISFYIEPGVDLEPAYFGKVIRGRIKKQVIEKRSGHFRGWRTAGPQAPVNLQQSLIGIGNLIKSQCLSE